MRGAREDKMNYRGGEKGAVKEVHKKERWAKDGEIETENKNGADGNWIERKTEGGKERDV